MQTVFIKILLAAYAAILGGMPLSVHNYEYSYLSAKYEHGTTWNMTISEYVAVMVGENIAEDSEKYGYLLDQLTPQQRDIAELIIGIHEGQ